MHYNLSLALAAGGNFAEAERELEEALRIDPKNQSAAAGLRLLKAQAGQPPAAAPNSKKQDH